MENHSINDYILDMNPDTVIPSKIGDLIGRLEAVFGVTFDYNPCFTLYNRGGWPYAKGEALIYTVCTFSMADGPSEDWSKELKQILKPCGFSCESFGNNGLDPAESYGQDTFWHYAFIWDDSFEEI